MIYWAKKINIYLLFFMKWINKHITLKLYFFSIENLKKHCYDDLKY